MTIAYATATRNARMDAITTQVGASGILRIYDGVRPATGGAITTLLSSHTCAATFAPAAAAGVLTANAIGSATAAATSTATWFRLFQSNGTTIIADGSAGADVVTTATGTINTDTITVGSNTGIVIGMYVSGTGIATGARVVDIVTTTIHLSIRNTGAVSGNGTFFWDLRLTPAAITATQTVNINSLVLTEGNP